MLASHRPTPSRRAPLGRAAVASLALVLATGCGGGSSDGGRSGDGDGAAAEVLTEEQATTALLTETNVGDELPVVPSEEEAEDEDFSLGCLDEITEVEETDAPVEAERDFEAPNDFGAPAINNQVSSFEATAEAEAAFDAFRAAVEGCETVDVTDDGGARIQLDLTVDDETVEAAHDQVNLEATGSISAEGIEFPFGIRFSAARVDNHVTTVAVLDLDSDLREQAPELVALAVDRLAAVAAGEEPDDDAVLDPAGDA